MSDEQDWKIFTGKEHASADDAVARLRSLASPPWRDFKKQEQPFVADDLTVGMVNAAIYLRRPLLVTGKPGTGKSALARAIARQLHIEPLLKWPVTTRTTLQDGLYRYDALGRLRDVQTHPKGGSDDTIEDVARYIRLGPLGTAFASPDRPRVLLIDEIDKGDIDLPNDLLHIFEDGEFVISELTRLLLKPDAQQTTERQSVTVDVETDDNSTVAISNGRIQCAFFPIIVLTSNGERAFPPAFLRRCIQLEIQQPDKDRLEEIVKKHLGEQCYTRAEKQIKQYITTFVQKRTEAKGDLATDQLLNLIYLMTRDVQLDEAAKATLEKKLLERLSVD